MQPYNPYRNPEPYIPATLSEIWDQLASMTLSAPTFKDKSGAFPDMNIDTEFKRLVAAFNVVGKKLGEDRYAALIDLAAQAKALFAADQDETNGKTDEGYKLLFQIEDLIQAARRTRTKAKLPDDEGEVTGD